MAKSYKDSVKAQAREKWRSFLEGTVLSRKKAQDVRVVCFPGAEVQGEEALEVREVYDPLGIPRENITGLEYDPKTAERLERANLGIRVIGKDDLEYFSTTADTFDAISLDYTGPQTQKAIKTLDAIAGRHILAPWGVIHTNYLGHRETKDLQDFMQLVRIWGKLDVPDDAYDQIERHGLSGYLSQRKIAEKKPKLADARNAITEQLMASLRAGSFSWAPYPNIFSGTPERTEWVKSTMKRSGFGEEQRKSVEQAYFVEATAKLIGSAPEKLGISRRQMRSILTLMHGIVADTYLIEDIERYSYVSNKGSSMLTDFVATRPLQSRAKKILPDVARIRNEILEIKPRKGLKMSKFYKTLTELSRFESEIVRSARDIPERQFLGSSCVRKQRISKQDAIGLLREGCSPAEIEECFAGFKIMQLAAFKAHYVTMGKKFG